MAMKSIEELMRASITDEDLATIYLGTAEEASERSLRTFVARQSGDNAAEIKESRGLLHFTGPAIVDHSVPISAVGSALSMIQRVLDAIGAAKEGSSSTNGQIPNRIKSRTELRMDASPMPGSVTISVRPSMPREQSLCPSGQTLLDFSDVELRPLADECFEDFITILSSTTDDSPEHDKLIDLLSEFGPRTSSAVREFCNILDRDSLNVDLKWEEPKKQPIKGEMSHTRARFVSGIIKDADIEVETVTLVGTLVTSTMSKKDKFRLHFEDGTEKTLTLGKISPVDVSQFHTGETVTITAERRVGRYTGGREREWLVGIEIRPKDQLSIDDI